MHFCLVATLNFRFCARQRCLQMYILLWKMDVHKVMVAVENESLGTTLHLLLNTNKASCIPMHFSPSFFIV